MALAARTVFFFQKIGLLLGAVGQGKKSVNAGLPALKAAAVRKRGVGFVLRDEHPQGRHVGQFGGILTPGKP